LKRILYVEDNPDVAESVACYLDLVGGNAVGEGYKVKVVGSISDARKELDETKALGAPPYDMVLTDGNLPDGNGGDLAVELEAQGMPVLIYSSDTANRRVGIAFLAKPATMPGLVDHIREVIRQGPATQVTQP